MSSMRVHAVFHSSPGGMLEIVLFLYCFVYFNYDIVSGKASTYLFITAAGGDAKH